MIIDGKAIAENIKNKLKDQMAGRSLLLVVFQVGSDPASRAFVRRKQKFGEDIGVKVDIREYPEDVTTEKLKKDIEITTKDRTVTGIIVQLPLPKQLDTQRILGLIPPDKDVDALSCNPVVVSPVVGAIAEIFRRHSIDAKDKLTIIVGKGRLVGVPAAEWIKKQGGKVVFIGRRTKNISDETKKADIIISGAGVPRLIGPNMVKDGVVLIDAGTSEEVGRIVGDIDPACAAKASFFSQVPGGVGPITVAMLFKNLLTLAEKGKCV
jgi:methylenetetrahydrofolate dehydrogenase (NADP+)/methenyltetrahydrofolate cyclohydrolase